MHFRGPLLTTRICLTQPLVRCITFYDMNRKGHFGLLSALLLIASSASASSLVVPSSFTGTPGNHSTDISGTSDFRAQLVYGSGLFGALGGTPALISGFYMRVAPNTGAFEWDTPLQITASTTQAYPNTNSGHTLPSTTFAANTGPDATVVFNSQLNITSAGCTGSGPCAFDLYFPFATSFNYNPNAGRLLLDLVFGTATTASGSFDAVIFANFTTSSVVSLLGPSTSATGSLDSDGPIIQLIYTPEPATFATVLLAGIALMFGRQRAQRT